MLSQRKRNRPLSTTRSHPHPHKRLFWAPDPFSRPRPRSSLWRDPSQRLLLLAQSPVPAAIPHRMFRIPWKPRHLTAALRVPALRASLQSHKTSRPCSGAVVVRRAHVLVALNTRASMLWHRRNPALHRVLPVLTAVLAHQRYSNGSSLVLQHFLSPHRHGSLSKLTHTTP